MSTQPLLVPESQEHPRRIGKPLNRSFLGKIKFNMTSELKPARGKAFNSMGNPEIELDQIDIAHSRMFSDLMRKHTKLYKTWRWYDLVSNFYKVSTIRLSH